MKRIEDRRKGMPLAAGPPAGERTASHATSLR
jgi:hypothetical protein